MAKDIKLLAEAYMGIYEAAPGNVFAPGNTLQAVGNFFHKNIGNMPKERVDQYWQIAQQAAQQPANPNDPYSLVRKQMAQRNYEQAKAQYEKEQGVATRTQVAYTPPTGTTTAQTPRSTSAATTAATPSKEELLKKISGTDQAIKNAANPQLQSIQNTDKAFAQAFNKQQPVAKASSQTQAPQQQTKQARMGGGGRLPGRKSDWASK